MNQKPFPGNQSLKLILLMAVTLILYGQLLKAQKNYGFGAMGKRPVTIHAADSIVLSDLFRSVWEQTRLQAFFNDEQISSDEVIRVKEFNQEPLDNLLTWLLKDRNLNWYYREETFVILPKKPGELMPGEVPPSPLAVSGQVTNESGEPLQNVSVQLLGTRKGTYTDKSGLFSLSATGKKVTLLISCIGFVSKQVLAGAGPVKVQLAPAVSSLDEIIAIGYGVTSKRYTTGSVSRVGAGVIEIQPVSNVLDALQGRIAGLSIIPLSGLPGSNFKVQLRGRNSIGSGNNPLFILDGVPLPVSSMTWDYNSSEGPNYLPATAKGLGAGKSASPLNVVNLADIESVSVLKDADATAIYGSRGANGIILITTKKGRAASKPVIGIGVYSGMGKMEHYIPYLDTRGYLDMRKEAFKNDRTAPGPYDYDVNGSWDSNRYTDWQRTLIGGTAHITDAQGVVSGGTSNVRYLVSGGFRRETTTYPGRFDYKKGGGRVNLFFSSPDNRWRTSVNAGYISDHNYLPSKDLTAFSTTPPNTPPAFNPDGTLHWQAGFDNPFAAAGRQYKASTDNLLVSATTGYAILPWLEFKASLGYNRMSVDEVQINPKASIDPVYNATTGNSHYGFTSIKNWILEPQLVFDKRLGQATFSTTIGATLQQEIRDQKILFATGFDSDATLEDITTARTITAEGALKSSYRYNAVFGRMSYNYGNKYIVTLTGRRDGSSKFGPGRQYADFWAIGAGWIFSGESFMSSALPALSYGKVRASVGVTGNDQIKDYVEVPGTPNSDYSWELVKKSELGLDLGFLKDKLLLSATWYHNVTSNMLIEDKIPGMGGGSITILRNTDARVLNRGLELEASGNLLRRKDVTWELSANFSLPMGELLKMPSVNPSAYDNYYTVGRPLDIFKGYHMLGVDPKTGVYFFEDINRDGVVDVRDNTYTKVNGIICYGALFNKITYKGFELSLLVQFVKQNGYNYQYAFIPPGPGIAVNQPSTVTGRWTEQGSIAGIQKFSAGTDPDVINAFAMAMTSDQTITDASFIRLKNLSLSYSPPARWLQKLHLKTGNLYIRGQNLLTLTRYPGRNPETSISTSEVYPPVRIMTAGLQIGL